MVNPTANRNATSFTKGLTVSALSPATLQFLAKRVGDIVEARVIKVTADLVSATTPGASTGRESAPPSAQPNRPSTTKEGPTGNNAAQSYRVELAVGNARLQVEASLAPRLGQLLNLEVLNARQVRLLPLTSKSPAAPGDAQSGAANVSLSPAKNAATGLGSQSQNTIAEPTARLQIVQSALRNTLPRALTPPALRAALSILAAAPTVAESVSSSNTANKVAPPAGSQQTAQRPTGAIAGQAAIESLLNALRLSQQQSQQQSHTLSTDSAVSRQSQNPAAAILHSLNRLNTLIPEARTLNTVDAVRNAIQQSGLTYEQKLANTIRSALNTVSATSRTVSEPGNAYTQSAARDNQLAHLRDALKQDTFQRDTKYQLLNLVKHIHALIKVQADPLLSTSSTGAQQLLSALQDSPTHFAELWKLDGSAFSSQLTNALNASNSDHSLDPLLQLLRLSLGILARNQNHQWLALGSQFAAGNETAVNQSLSLELPVWLHQQLALIDIRIEREREKNPRKQPASQLWHLRLRFDFEELGELTALASLRQKTVSAVFWASNSALAKKIDRELASVKLTLDSAGINVQSLQCRVGTIDRNDSESIASLLASSLLSTQV